MASRAGCALVSWRDAPPSRPSGRRTPHVPSSSERRSSPPPHPGDVVTRHQARRRVVLAEPNILRVARRELRACPEVEAAGVEALLQHAGRHGGRRKPYTSASRDGSESGTRREQELILATDTRSFAYRGLHAKVEEHQALTTLLLRGIEAAQRKDVADRRPALRRSHELHAQQRRPKAMNNEVQIALTPRTDSLRQPDPPRTTRARIERITGRRDPGRRSTTNRAHHCTSCEARALVGGLRPAVAVRPGRGGLTRAFACRRRVVADRF